MNNCPCLFCVADDITGAAEIAGVALAMGLRVSLLMHGGTLTDSLPDCDVCVVATDSRSMSPQDAACCVADVCKGILRLMGGSRGFTVFKKTDSVLRGNILRELTSMAGLLGSSNVLLLPQNPSKGRIIIGGKYLVDNIPLSETDFRSDPEFPALHDEPTLILLSNARAAASDSLMPVVGIATDSRSLAAGSVCVADAYGEEQIDSQLAKASESTLLAGGADFFAAVVRKLYGQSARCDASPRQEAAEGSLLMGITRDGGKVIVVCGSTQSASLAATPLMQHVSSREEPMPDDVFEGLPDEAWHMRLVESWTDSQLLTVSIGNHPRRGADYARRLRREMAVAVSRLCSSRQPEALVIEGGATAFCVLSLLGWSLFRVERQISPGVVALRLSQNASGVSSPLVILKPGSYPWGRIFG